MREKNVLRVCGLGLVLALMAAMSGPAFGATVFATGSVTTNSGGWLEVIPLSGSPSANGSSAHGTMFAEIDAGAEGGTAAWDVFAKASATGTDQFRGAGAAGAIELTITDKVTATLQNPEDYEPDVLLLYFQPFFIDGTTIGSASGTGSSFLSAAYFQVDVDGRTVAGGEETLTSDLGYLATMPRGRVQSLGIGLRPSVPVDLSIVIGAAATADTIEDVGAANGTSDFSHTFRWGEVTDVFNADTGERIPAEFFHLYGEDGFDWAHPPAVPEPGTLCLLTPLALFLSRRRTSRTGSGSPFSAKLDGRSRASRIGSLLVWPCRFRLAGQINEEVTRRREKPIRLGQRLRRLEVALRRRVSWNWDRQRVGCGPFRRTRTQQWHPAAWLGGVLDHETTNPPKHRRLRLRCDARRFLKRMGRLGHQRAVAVASFRVAHPKEDIGSQ